MIIMVSYLQNCPNNTKPVQCSKKNTCILYSAVDCGKWQLMCVD